MGVPGLWKLLDSVKCPVNFEQLSGMVVAIDMNIWLHQALKSRATSDYQGAYLAILFHRICKLLYFGIRPVFVFDGDVPALKKSTMVSRRLLRRQLGGRAEKAEQRLVKRLLHRIAEGATVSQGDVDESPSHTAAEHSGQNRSDKAKAELLHRLSRREDVIQAKEDAQLFEIPEEQEDINFMQSGDLLHERAGLEFDDLARDYLASVDLYSPTASLDLHSEVFCALPPRAQMRVIQLARERLDSTYRNQCGRSKTPYFSTECDEDSTDAEVFSTQQMSRLLLRHKLSERHQELSSRLTTEEAASQLKEQMVKDGSPNQQQRQHWASVLRSQIEDWAQSAGSTAVDFAPVINALKIQSRSSGHAILVKKSPLKSVVDSNAPVPQTAKFGQVVSLESLIDFSGNTIDTPAKEDDNYDNITLLKQSQQIDEQSPSPDSLLSVDTSYPDKTVSELKSSQPATDGTIKSDSKRVLPATIYHEVSDTLDLPLTVEKDHLCESLRLSVPANRSNSTHVDSEDMELLPHPPIVTSGLPTDSVMSPITESLQDISGEEDDFIEVGEDELQRRQEWSQPSEEAVDFSDSDASSDLVSVVTIDCEAARDSPVMADQPEVEATVGCMSVSVEDNQEEEEDDENEYFRLDDAVLREEADRLTRQAQTTTKRYIEEAQELLRLFGLPYVVSPEEAEAQCVSLQRSGLVDLVASDDSDVWPFGASAVCRHLFGGAGSKRQQRETTSACQYTVGELRNKLGLSPPNLLRLALLCGSDYTTGIPNVGPVTAVEILSEFETSTSCSDTDEWNLPSTDKPLEAMVDSVLAPLRRFVEWWNSASELNKVSEVDVPSVRRKWLKLRPPPGFPDRQVIRAYLQPNVDRRTAPFVWNSPDTQGLVKHATTRLCWRPDTTEAMLSAVIKHQHLRLTRKTSETATAALITDYFVQHRQQQEEENLSKGDSTESLSIQSKRLRLATRRLRTKTPGEPVTSSPNPELLSAQYSQMPLQGSRRGSRRRGVHQYRPSTNRSAGNTHVSPPSSSIQVPKKSSRSRRISQQRAVVQRAAISDDDEES